MKKIFFILKLIIIIFCFKTAKLYSQNSITIDGFNFGKHLIIENSDSILLIRVNNRFSKIDHSLRFIEIDFDFLEIPLNTSLKILIIYKNKYAPRILNPECITRRNLRCINIIGEATDKNNNKEFKYYLNAKGFCIIKGKIFDLDTGSIIADASIVLSDQLGERNIGTKVDKKTSTYLLVAKYGHYYRLSILTNKKVKTAIINLMNVPKTTESQLLIANFCLSNDFHFEIISNTSKDDGPYSSSNRYFAPVIPMNRAFYDTIDKKIKWDVEYSNWIGRAYNSLLRISNLEDKLEIIQWKRKANNLLKNEKINWSKMKTGDTLQSQAHILTYSLNKQKEKSYKNEIERIKATRLTRLSILSVFVTILISIVLTLAYKNQRRLKEHYERQKSEVYMQRKILEEKKIELEKLQNIKNKLFSIIYHDLKKPLCSMQNLIETIKERPDFNNESQLVYLDSSMKKTVTLLDSLLYWSIDQIEGTNFRLVLINIYRIVGEAISLYNDMASVKQLIIENNCNKSDEAFADESSVKLILRNLISNAIKFTPSNGTIAISSASLNDKIKIVVNDSGIGITPAELSTLFRIDRLNLKRISNEKGAAQGLILCKEFAQKNGGEIEIKSEAGKGTTVSLTLKRL
jgi:signal transduction histidine kinase